MVGKASNKPKKAAKKGDGSKPVLLSGGNPQIPKGHGEAPVRAYLDAMPGWKQGVGRRLAALGERTVPDVRKAVKWHSPLYGAPAAPPAHRSAERRVGKESVSTCRSRSSH